MANREYIEACARAAHEANRAYCMAIGDNSQVPWEDAAEWQKESARIGVEGVIVHGNSPEQSHESWLAEKRRSGWVYGDVKDVERKTHPCMVAYDRLPDAQRRKDHIFVCVVRAVAGALLSPNADDISRGAA